MRNVILIIEDHEDNRRIIRDLLTSAGYEIIEATSAGEGVTAAETYRPSLILMDIQLPTVSGLDVTKRLKDNEELCSIPVVAVTAFAMKGDEEKIRDGGCDGYIAKPISVPNFLKTVAEFIG